MERADRLRFGGRFVELVIRATKHEGVKGLIMVIFQDAVVTFQPLVVHRRAIELRRKEPRSVA